MSSADDKRVYNSMAWRRLRALVLERDGYACQVRLDGCRGAATQVDHIVAMSDGGPPLSPLNARAACSHCNASRVSTTKVGQLGTSPSRRW